MMYLSNFNQCLTLYNTHDEWRGNRASISSSFFSFPQLIIPPCSILIITLRCAIAMTRQHVTRPSVFKPGTSSLTQHWAANRIRFDLTLFSVMLGSRHHNILIIVFTPTLLEFWVSTYRWKDKAKTPKGYSDL